MKRKLPWGPIMILASIALAIELASGCGSDAANDQIASPDGGNDSAAADGSGSGTSTSTSSSSGSTGNDSGAPTDASTRDAISYADSSLGDATSCKDTSTTCATSNECCSANCDIATKQCAPPIGTCKSPGTSCGAPNECCTGACVNSVCADKQCVSDKPTAGTCQQSGDCCSGICATGTCASANPGQSCRTSGNLCTTANDCCSKLCNNGVCSSAVSFCTQEGEVCSTSFECCGGNCTKQAGNTTGVCGAPTSGGGVPSGCAPSGTVCGTAAGVGDAGLPPCDQNCCSRACGFFGGQAGFRVCQPPSGCRPTGEVCRADSDCCGWSGAPDPVNGPVTCSKASATSEFGRCDNGGACREPGSICKPGDGDSCSAENNCCEHSSLPSNFCNSNPENCCNKDALGIPRCLIKPVDCAGAAPAAGTVCATSADCCGNPCVGNKCGAPNSCISKGSTCSTSADCCPGLPCVQAPGSTKGICGGTLTADGGVSDAGSTTPTFDAGTSTDGGACGLYGQLCVSAGDCCNSVPCTAGRCRFP